MKIASQKCPACGGTVSYDLSSTVVKCSYCGNTFSPERVSLEDASEDRRAFKSVPHAIDAEELEARSPWAEEEGLGSALTAVSCPSCAAVFAIDQTSAASCCPYCGNNLVSIGSQGDKVVPDLLIPFKTSEQEAVDALQQHCKGHWFLPFGFASKIKHVVPMFIPYCIYDVLVKGSGRFIWTEHGEHPRYAPAIVGGQEAFTWIADVSAKMPDTLTDAIAPYDLACAVPFSPGYVAGGIALEMADEHSATTKQRTYDALKKVFQVHLSQYAADQYNIPEAPSHSFSAVDLQHDFYFSQDRMCLMPVWIAQSSYGKGSFICAVNGQNGKCVGNLPVSKVKRWLIDIFPAVCIFALTMMFVLLSSGGESSFDDLDKAIAASLFLAVPIGGILGYGIDLKQMKAMRSAVLSDEIWDADMPESKLEVDDFVGGTDCIKHSRSAACAVLGIDEATADRNAVAIAISTKRITQDYSYSPTE